MSLLGLCGVVAVTPVSSAELYKWVDESGVTQYSQTPPPGNTEVQTLDITVTPTDQSALEKLKSNVNTVDEMRETRLQDQEAKRLAAEEKAVNEENCRRARARMASYQIPNALIAQADGSRMRVDENTRLKELAASQEMIKQYCK
jgi:hypothetical protein